MQIALCSQFAGGLLQLFFKKTGEVSEQPGKIAKPYRQSNKTFDVIATFICTNTH